MYVLFTLQNPLYGLYLTGTVYTAGDPALSVMFSEQVRQDQRVPELLNRTDHARVDAC